MVHGTMVSFSQTKLPVLTIFSFGEIPLTILDRVVRTKLAKLENGTIGLALTASNAKLTNFEHVTACDPLLRFS
eukprot:2229600-Prymnesium_polylepis.1